MYVYVLIRINTNCGLFLDVNTLAANFKATSMVSNSKVGPTQPQSNAPASSRYNPPYQPVSGQQYPSQPAPQALNPEDFMPPVSISSVGL